jgi:hypothetical protein
MQRSVLSHSFFSFTAVIDNCFCDFRLMLDRNCSPSAKSFMLNAVHLPNAQETRRRVWRHAQSRPTHVAAPAGVDACTPPAELWPLLPQAIDPAPQSTHRLDVTTLFTPLQGLLEVTPPPNNRVLPEVFTDITEVSSVHPKGRVHVAVPVGGLHVSTLNHVIGPGGYCSQHCVVTGMSCAICEMDDADCLKCAFCLSCFHFDCLGLDRLALFLATMEGSFYKCGACTLLSYPVHH